MMKEEISVIIMSTIPNFKSSFICKKSDKFEVLIQKLYLKEPELKNKSGYFLHCGELIDVEKTIKDNKIENNGMILYNVQV